ncbi:VanZ family protein [Gilvimarinus sp. SDUM040013]|uniref:VanZ family protein n=1 Tax=Gilvimarinus gilvus TaxID=3058038 RepID=A0ABU4RXY1_9GAMM|nr:VanZ family protein [Gilvimarinus sp. SDUM040013]MDO3388274.1 VanZ family protein [Gilvimarinus sp. SDUM040013]MDX6847824.1 VanZ family protein [Gilvimarinus sp. SDUM040013]
MSLQNLNAGSALVEPMWTLCKQGQFWALLAIYLLLGTAQQPQQVVGDYNDLLMHFLGYLVAGISISIAYPKQSVYARLMWLWLFSTGVEIIQYFLPWRSFDLWDMLANTSGIVLGLVIFSCACLIVRRNKSTHIV